MDLVARLTPLFSATSRARGLDYFRDGRVEIGTRGDKDLLIFVAGTYEYDVRLRKRGSQLLLSCTCPHFDDGFPCKHIWGALLGVQADPGLAGWMQSDATDVVFDYPWNEQDEGEWFEEKQGAPSHPDAPRPASSPAWRPPNTADAVRRFLEYRERRGLGPAGPGASPAAGQGLVAAFPTREGAPEASTAWRAPFDRIRDAMGRRDAGEADWAEVSPEQIVYLVDVQNSLTYGNLAIAINRRDRKKNGDWGKPKPLRIRRSQVSQLPDDTDRRLVSSLVGSSEWYHAVDYSPLPSLLHVPPDLARTLVPALCGTSRLFLGRNGSIDSPALAWGGDEPWRFRVQVTPTGDNGGTRYQVSGWLVRAGDRLPLAAPRLVTPSLAFFPDRVAPLDPADAWPWLAELRGNPSITVPAAQATRFVETLFSLPHVPPVDLPEDLRVEEHAPEPVPCLRLFHSDRMGGRIKHITADLSFDYDGMLVPATEHRSAIYRPEPRVLVRRQLESERRARAELVRLGFHKEENFRSGIDALTIDPHRVPRAIRDLLGAGWRVEADGQLYRPVGRSRLSVKSGIDWFELHGEAEFGDQVATLPHLLAALSRGERVITLGDGSLGMLPEEWLRRFAGIAELGEAEGDYVRFRPSQVAVLDALLAAQPETRFDAAFEHAREALRRFEAVAPLDPPATFNGELRAYQREGLGWLEFLRTFGFGGCLADDMGLGKTVMVLALLERNREGTRRPSLVVAPRSVVFNWVREAERFTPQLRVADYTGPNRADVLDRLDLVDLFVTTYGTLRQDAARLKDVAFEYVVLDESQAIKNAATASSKAARLLTANHRLALSGTPIENHVGELWSLFDFLNPGMLGSGAVFGRKRGKAAGRLRPKPGEERGQRAAPNAATEAAERVRDAAERPEEGEPAPSADLQLVARAVRPFILRRTKGQVASDLPARQEETIWCELEGAERRLYDELRDHYRATLRGLIERKGLGRSKLQVLEALLRLRQAACHPGLLDRARANDTSAKLDALLPQLAEVREEGHKALVFSQFTSLLAILRKQLDGEGVPYEYLDGQTRDREARVARFQEREDCRLFLISLKAGGLGLNLTAADYVFLLDPWWNPAVEAQAIDRTHRIGQTRPVFAYRLIARDTVEERILDLQRHKRDLAEAIITADNSVIGNLTREELEALLS